MTRASGLYTGRIGGRGNKSVCSSSQGLQGRRPIRQDDLRKGRVSSGTGVVYRKYDRVAVIDKLVDPNDVVTRAVPGLVRAFKTG